MAGKLPRTVSLPALVAVVLAAAAPACTRNIPQDSATGKDGNRKGAKVVRIEDGEGRANDTVTYPGGDRIDWKKFEIPEGPGGKLTVKLKITPPRDGHTVAFILYDQYYRPLERSTKKPKRVKRATVKRADPGTYYLQIYAPERKDAGQYRLSIRYRERDPSSEDVCEKNPELPQCDDDIPQPPTLPAVPEAECRRDADCKDGAQCVENVCKAKDPCAEMTCPEGQVCQAQGTRGVCIEEQVEQSCVTASLVNYQMSGGSVVITVDRGKSAGVEQGWSGQVLVKGTSRPLGGGSFKVTKVTSGESVGKVRLSLDQLSANRRIQLCPN